MVTNNTTDGAVGKDLGPSVPVQTPSMDEKQDFSTKEKHLEQSPGEVANLSYNDDEAEPELHMRTWLALAAMWLLNYVQVVALQGPPAVVCKSVPLCGLPHFDETCMN